MMYEICENYVATIGFSFFKKKLSRDPMKYEAIQINKWV